MEERKRGRPIKFSKEYMVKMKAVYSGTRAGNRHIQNHFYQACSFPEIMKYHNEYSIENFEFLYKDETHFKETIFTELGRTKGNMRVGLIIIKAGENIKELIGEQLDGG